VRRARTWLPGLLLVAPSIVAIGVFVYGMLGWNFQLAMTDKHDEVSEGNFVGLQNFIDIWDQPRWHLSVNHAIVFTIVFVVGALVLGWLLAFLMEKGIWGEGTFRAIYLFPMAVSFVATGIVWRWLMNSGMEERAVGLNRLFDAIGLPQWQWFRDPDWGMAAMALPAIWQMSGYVMALFLAGFRGVPEEHPGAHLAQGVRPDRRGLRQADHHRRAGGVHVGGGLRLPRPGQGRHHRVLHRAERGRVRDPVPDLVRA
jgi:glucose/mannose transport system permease protein